MNELDGDEESGFVKTSMNLEDEYSERLDDSLNEFYLWHGSSPEGVEPAPWTIKSDFHETD